MAGLTDAQKVTNHSYFLDLVQNTLCDPDFDYPSNAWRETNEKIILVVLSENPDFLDVLNFISLHGKIPDLTEGEYRLSYTSLKPSYIERRLRKMFKWKGTLSTVVRICDELASWHWITQQLVSQTGTRKTYQYTINTEIFETCLTHPLDIPEEEIEENETEEAID